MYRLLIFLLICSGVQLSAQEISYGFEVGLNFSSFNGPAETDDAGAEVESFKSTNGFHVGGNLRLKIVDRFGVKAELLFSQKGGKNVYDGEAVQLFNAESGEILLAGGTRNSVISVTNSYIEIPVTGYFRPVSRLEIYAGANVAFLVGSTGIGELTYNGQTSIGGDPISFLAELDHNYFKDKGRLETELTDNDELINFEVNGETVQFPQSLGAYFLDFDTKDGSYYNKVDVGLVGGLSLYFNSSLYLGFRANYGLVDVTNNTYDISRVASNGLEPLARSDKDVNLSLQASLGFSF